MGLNEREEVGMKLGPRVLGDEEFARQQKAHEEAAKRAFVYGPRVVGSEPAADEKPTAESTPSPAPEGDADGDGETTVAQIKQALEGDVSDETIDGLLASEFERSGDGPRKGVLRLLLKAEQGRGEASRAAIVAELQNALELKG